MSFILDALRKVEKERKEPSPVELDQLIHKKDGKGSPAPRPNRFLVGLTALMVSSMAVWFLLDRYTNFSVPPFPGGKKSHRAATAPAGAVKPGKVPTAGLKPGIPTASPITGHAPSTSSTEVSKTPQAVAQTEPSAAKSLASITERSIKKVEKRTAATPPAVTRIAPKAKKTAKQPSTEQRQAKAVLTVAPSKPKPPTLVRTSRLVLEGILFHSDIGKRSAMIRDRRDGKNRLVKVKDTFKGYTVEVIEISKVILLKGNSMIVLKLE